MYDFTFLAPCPASGIIIHGGRDDIVPKLDVDKLVDKLNMQRGITITYKPIPEADHFFAQHMDEMMSLVDGYLDERLPAMA